MKPSDFKTLQQRLCPPALDPSVKRQPKDIQDWTRLVLDRDDWTCQQCLSRTNLDAAHIVPRTHAETRLDVDNGVTLCRRCHQIFHADPVRFDYWIESRGLTR